MEGAEIECFPTIQQTLKLPSHAFLQTNSIHTILHNYSTSLEDKHNIAESQTEVPNTTTNIRCVCPGTALQHRALWKRKGKSTPLGVV